MRLPISSKSSAVASLGMRCSKVIGLSTNTASSILVRSLRLFFVEFDGELHSSVQMYFFTSSGSCSLSNLSASKACSSYSQFAPWA